MTFDVGNPSHLTTLKTEVETDPLLFGYATVQNDTQLVALLNDAALNLVKDPANATVTRAFDARAMLDALDPANLDAQQTNTHAMEYIHALLHAEAGLAIPIAPHKAKFEGLFAANSSTRTALAAQITTLTRGEVLFGAGTIISRFDWGAARDNG